MVDKVVSKQELVDAQKDAETLAQVANGPAGQLVKSRNGREFYTLATFPNISVYSRDETLSKAEFNTALAGISGGYFKTYATLDLANADIANIPLNVSVRVSSATEGGDYHKETTGATTLKKSAYDPLTQSKIHTVSSIKELTFERINVPAGNIQRFTDCYNLTSGIMETYTKWQSFKYTLSGKETAIGGKFAAHYNGAGGTLNTIKVPAIAFFDKNDKLLSYNLPTDAANGKVYELFEVIPLDAAYVLLAYSITGLNNVPTLMSGYGEIEIYVEKEYKNSTAKRALELIEQNGLITTNESTIYLNDVAKNPNALAGQAGVYALNKAFQGWFSYKLDLSGYTRLTGTISAFRNSDGRFLPAIVIYDKTGNVVQYAEHSTDSQALINVDIEITSTMSYAIINNSITHNAFIKLKKLSGDVSISEKVVDVQNILQINGISKLNTIKTPLSARTDDAIVWTGSDGSYVKTNTYEAWYCLMVELTDATHVTGISNDYYNGAVRIPSVIVFNASGQVIKYYDKATSSAVTGENAAFDFDVTAEMAYMFVQYQNQKTYPYIEVTYNTDVAPSILQRLEAVEAKSNTLYPSLSLLVPKHIYNVANDIDYKVTGQTYTGLRSELKRNFSAVMYVDNFIPYVASEPNISFEDKALKKVIPAYSPVITAGAIENPNLNNGSNVYTETVSYKVKGNQAEDQAFTLENRSVLNSASKDKTPTILVIGDSVSFGQDAYFPGSKNKWNYTMILNKMFMNDRQQNGGTGYGFRTVGTIAHTDKDGIKSFNEAYSGTTLQGAGLFTNSKFLDGNNNFSFQNWLDKYRTCDDNGNRLYFSASQATTGTAGANNTGYLADGSATAFKIGNQVSNTLAHDVYKPTHVFCFHGSNSPVGASDYNLFISRVRSVFPNAVVGLGVPHVAGTYFPSKYPNVYRSAIWQYDQTYNNRHVVTVQTLINDFWNYTQEANKVFVLPTFWVNPSAEAFSSIFVNEPHSEFTGCGLIEMPVGQRVDVHVGSKAQAAYAYQLYAWLKWTAANNLF